MFMQKYNKLAIKNKLKLEEKNYEQVTFLWWKKFPIKEAN